MTTSNGTASQNQLVPTKGPLLPSQIVVYIICLLSSVGAVRQSISMLRQDRERHLHSQAAQVQPFMQPQATQVQQGKAAPPTPTQAELDARAAEAAQAAKAQEAEQMRHYSIAFGEVPSSPSPTPAPDPHAKWQREHDAYVVDVKRRAAAATTQDEKTAIQKEIAAWKQAHPEPARPVDPDRIVIQQPTR